MIGFLNYTLNIMGGTKRFYETVEVLSNPNISRKEYYELKKRVIEIEKIIKTLYIT